MPMFVFKCDECGKTEERIVKNSEIEEQQCDCSQQSHMTQVFDPSCNFILKGTWYKNAKRY